MSERPLQVRVCIFRGILLTRRNRREKARLNRSFFKKRDSAKKRGNAFCLIASLAVQPRPCLLTTTTSLIAEASFQNSSFFFEKKQSKMRSIKKDIAEFSDLLSDFFPLRTYNKSRFTLQNKREREKKKEEDNTQHSQQKKRRRKKVNKSLEEKKKEEISQISQGQRFPESDVRKKKKMGRKSGCWSKNESRIYILDIQIFRADKAKQFRSRFT